MTSSIQISNLKFSYSSQKNILDISSLQISEGEKVFIYGPSGYGKSTLLNIISGFSLSFFKKFFFLSAIPVLLILAISTLEFGVALLQAYVFLNLLLIYLSDTLSLHH